MHTSENNTPSSCFVLPAAVAAGATTVRASGSHQAPASHIPGSTKTLRFDEDYIRALTNRRGDAVQDFVSHFSKPVKSKLRGHLRSLELREDAFQETFRRVLNYFYAGKTLENPASLPGFVYAVCHNTALELLRSNLRHLQFADETPDPVDSTQNPEERMVTEERKQIVRRVLRELRQRDRELLERVFLNEEDKDLVCEQLGVDRTYLRVLLHRARVRLKRRWWARNSRLGGCSRGEMTTSALQRVTAFLKKEK
jgi:RNA polymerase sigma-70 factor (ECF subfamily)